MTQLRAYPHLSYLLTIHRKRVLIRRHHFRLLQRPRV